MKYIILTLLIAFAVISSSCSSHTTAPVSGDFTGDSEFTFDKLTSGNTTIEINGSTPVTAVATGKDLKYIWSAREGVVLGEGSNVSYTICHATTDIITCQITDYRNKSITKDISITIK